MTGERKLCKCCTGTGIRGCDKWPLRIYTVAITILAATAMYLNQQLINLFHDLERQNTRARGAVVLRIDGRNH